MGASAGAAEAGEDDGDGRANAALGFRIEDSFSAVPRWASLSYGVRAARRNPVGSGPTRLRSPGARYDRMVSLRGTPVEERTVLPSGREATVRVGVAEDPYIAPGKIDTVSLVVRSGNDVLAVVNTVLEPAHVSEARALVREVVAGLASGELEPTAGALEPYADRIPDVG